MEGQFVRLGRVFVLVDVFGQHRVFRLGRGRSRGCMGRVGCVR